MTIDEAIVYAKAVAERQRVSASVWINDDEISQHCIQRAKEQEQLAEWLEELNAYRNHVFSGDMTQSMLKEERNKAIDDFSEAVKVAVTEMDDIGAYDNLDQRIYEILQIEAERLKAGKYGDEPYPYHKQRENT